MKEKWAAVFARPIAAKEGAVNQQMQGQGKATRYTAPTWQKSELTWLSGYAGDWPIDGYSSIEKECRGWYGSEP